MRELVVFGLVFLFLNIGFAHEPNEAFFTYTEKENTVEVEAEFPWSLRNALLKFDPSLAHATDKRDFENAFNEYISKNLIIRDRDGNPLQFQGVYELENNGHSHQNSYLMVFKGHDLFEITNTIMFNLYGNQVNYNTVGAGQNVETFKTNNGVNHFKVGKSNIMEYGYYVLILILPIIYMVRRCFSGKNAAKGFTGH